VSLPYSPFCGIVWNDQASLPVRALHARTSPGGSFAVHQPIADAAAEDHEILVDDRRRRVRVVLLVDRPEQVVADVDHAVAAERVDRQSGLRVETDQPIARVQENAQRAAVAPRGDAAMHESLSARDRPVLVRFRIVGPQLPARHGIEGDDAVVGRAEIQHVLDHDRRHLERARSDVEIRQRALTGPPRPRGLQ